MGREQVRMGQGASLGASAVGSEVNVDPVQDHLHGDHDQEHAHQALQGGGEAGVIPARRPPPFALRQPMESPLFHSDLLTTHEPRPSTPKDTKSTKFSCHQIFASFVRFVVFPSHRLNRFMERLTARRPATPVFHPQPRRGEVFVVPAVRSSRAPSGAVSVAPLGLWIGLGRVSTKRSLLTELGNGVRTRRRGGVKRCAASPAPKGLRAPRFLRRVGTTSLSSQLAVQGVWNASLPGSWEWKTPRIGRVLGP